MGTWVLLPVWVIDPVKPDWERNQLDGIMVFTSDREWSDNPLSFSPRR